MVCVQFVFMCDKMSSLLSVCNLLSQKVVEEETMAVKTKGANCVKCNNVQCRICDDATRVEIIGHNNACHPLEDWKGLFRDQNHI